MIKNAVKKQKMQITNYQYFANVLLIVSSTILILYNEHKKWPKPDRIPVY
jgi:hypothetical protein